ncbi:PnuC-like nicotinamide riboside transporter [Gordonia phage VanLee]|uniref:PnuC-like nicotinamide riboside transporter n=1 Tax=Gordonia phage VanLee TaxID=2845816 RepID=A0A8F2IFE5_9CAUD|nr:PnuC-like nicotinamide riboside transporter [Gordonia phage VanLee]QWS68208.1 PnuC-like nicotinamide riboside transporter [Gordonia phage VanLee]
MWWSWLLASIGVFGLYLTTRKLWQGFVIGVGVQVLWIAYALATDQLGFIFSALAYGSVNALGFYRWTRPAETPADPEPPVGTIRSGLIRAVPAWVGERVVNRVPVLRPRPVRSTDPTAQKWAQLDSIPAPAIVTDAKGARFLKAFDDPAAEQFFDPDTGDHVFGLAAYSTPPYRWHR